MSYTYEEIAGMIDHSLLHPTMTDAELDEGCRLAAEYRTASVCIKPYYVARCAELLAGSGVAVCTVIGFPHGSPATEVKRYEAEVACKEGATELDMVVNVGKALSGDWAYVLADIKAVADEAHRHGATVKVIFETDYVSGDDDKRRLCQVTADAGAEFVKTSTGFGFVKQSGGGYDYRGATEHDLALMRAASPPSVRVKASGGVRTLDGVLKARELGCARVGATATAAILDEARRRIAAGETGVGDAKLGGGY